MINLNPSVIVVCIFLHINVNSLLSTIDELRDVVAQTKPAISGITESKLDSSVSDQEVNISD